MHIAPVVSETRITFNGIRYRSPLHDSRFHVAKLDDARICEIYDDSKRKIECWPVFLTPLSRVSCLQVQREEGWRLKNIMPWRVSFSHTYLSTRIMSTVWPTTATRQHAWKINSFRYSFRRVPNVCDNKKAAGVLQNEKRRKKKLLIASGYCCWLSQIDFI